jgi:hypothetical protein
MTASAEYGAAPSILPLQPVPGHPGQPPSAEPQLVIQERYSDSLGSSSWHRVDLELIGNAEGDQEALEQDRHAARRELSRETAEHA